MTFESLNLIPPLLRAVREKGYDKPTPIQIKAIPPAILGHDVLGVAQTGTGKTAAFALPILQRLWNTPKHAGARRPVLALVLCPTRELASQIGESFAKYGKHSGLRCAVVFGGVGYPRQREELVRGVDILVATPGRLLDLMGEGSARFGSLEVLVLDEADRMLDMGFLPDVKRILAAVPKKRQTLFFSATMPPEIQKLTQSMLHNPVQVAVAPVATTAEKVDQSVFFVQGSDKVSLLLHLLDKPEVTRALVFTRTKRGADRVAKRLMQSGVRADAIHGNKSQNARERNLATFKSGKGRVLVATDIAARGIDVTGISHVINFELPNEPESYVHRIGRTARAAASGIAWAFCSRDEREYLRDIERLIRQKIAIVEDHPYAAEGHSNGREPREARPARSSGRAKPAAFRGKPAGRPAHRTTARSASSVDAPRAPETSFGLGVESTHAPAAHRATTRPSHVREHTAPARKHAAPSRHASERRAPSSAPERGHAPQRHAAHRAAPARSAARDAAPHADRARSHDSAHKPARAAHPASHAARPAAHASTGPKRPAHGGPQRGAHGGAHRGAHGPARRDASGASSARSHDGGERGPRAPSRR